MYVVGASDLHSPQSVCGVWMSSRKGSSRARPNVPLWEQTRSQRRRNEYCLVVEYSQHWYIFFATVSVQLHPRCTDKLRFKEKYNQKSSCREWEGMLRKKSWDCRFLSVVNRYWGFLDIFLPPAPLLSASSACNEIGLNPHSYKKRNRRRKVCNWTACLSFSIVFAVH